MARVDMEAIEGKGSQCGVHRPVDVLLTPADEVVIEAEEVVASASVRAAFNRKISRRAQILLALFMVGMFVVSFSVGRYPVSPVQLVETLWWGFWQQLMALFQVTSSLVNLVSHSIGASFALPSVPDAWWHLFDSASITSAVKTVIFNIRLPRVLVAMLVGGALSVAGASYQGMFKNPLVSPDILGASAGASLGACLALLLNMPTTMIQLFAFTGGMLAVALAVSLNRMVKYDPILGLVLGGILVSTLFQAGMSLVKFLADADDKLPTITFWLMGSFASIGKRDLVAILLPMLIGFGLLMTQRWRLNVLSFGEEEARSMGVNTRITRLLVIFGSTLIVSTSVAVAGVIGWIGLVIPHLGRALVGPNYRVLLPVSVLLGSSYLLFVDDIARLAMSVELPIGILTAILGVPFFVVIFRHNVRGWS
ncbi:MAG: FecCD family ABC transporter permease [Coriobacteriia bacterium]